MPEAATTVEKKAFTEVTPLKERSVLCTVGVNGTRGCDVVNFQDNRFSVVDGIGSGDDPVSRTTAENTAKRLAEHVLETYFDGTTDRRLTLVPGIDKTNFISGAEREAGFMHGYARGGGYVVGWKEEDGLLQPTILYNGTDEVDAPIESYNFFHFQPVAYLGAFTDGGRELMGISRLFDGTGVNFDATRQEAIFYRRELNNEKLIGFLDSLTTYLRGLRRENRALASGVLARNMREFRYREGDGFTDDATMLLLEAWNTGHPEFTRPS